MRPFAGYLAQRGHRVLSFDLRGMGTSRRPEHRRSLRGLQADMLTWARQDFAAAVEWLAGPAPGGQIALMGHSLGMHHAAMTTPAAQARIAVAVSVAAGSGYWRDWASASRRKAPLMLHLAAPAMRQWNRWCGHPGFAWGAQPALVLPSSQTPRFRNNAYQKRPGCPHHISQSKKETHAPTYLHQAWSI